MKENGALQLTLSAFLFVVLGFSSLYADGVGQTSEQPQALSKVGMVSMNANDVALKIGGISVTFGDLFQHLNQNGSVTRPGANSQLPGEVFVNGLNGQQQSAFKSQLGRFLRSYILLLEAKKSGMTVSEEEKQAYVKRWSENFPEKKFENFIAGYPEESSNPLQMTKSDYFLLLKYTDNMLEGVKVPQKEIDKINSRIKLLTDSHDREQAMMREEMVKLAEDPALNTDEGFAALAIKMSEGEEASNGGIIPFELTRSQIVELNYDQPFETPVGQTSALIETPTALRYIRVLEEHPGERAGEPPLLKIAQILKAKRELDGIPTKEEIEARLKRQFQERCAMEKVAQILESGMEFECPLFPKFKDEWPLPKNKRNKTQ